MGVMETKTNTSTNIKIEQLEPQIDVVSTISEEAYMQLKDNMQALNSAFAVHVKQTESELDEIKTKQQKEENTMEHKRLSDVTDTNVNARISQLENAVRSALEVKSSSIEDVQSAKLSALGLYLKTGNLESKSGIGAQDTLDGGVVLHETLTHWLMRDIWNSSLLGNATTIMINGKALKIHSRGSKSPRDYAKWGKVAANHVDAMKFERDYTTSDILLNTLLAESTMTYESLEDLSDTAVQKRVQDDVIESFKAQIEYSILFGKADESMEGIFTYDQANANQIKHTDLTEDELIDGLLAMTSAINVRYINKAAWYMSPAFLTKIMQSLLASKTTQFIEMLKMISDKDYGYTLFGKPVYLIPDMPAEHPVMLANMSSGYCVTQHGNANCKRIAIYELDTIYYGYRIRVGGKVVNPDAFVLANVNVDE